MRFHCLKNFLPALVLFLCCISVFGQAAGSTGSLTDEQRSNIALEALSRLQHVDVEKNPEFKSAVDKILVKTRGTPQFVLVVKQLKLQNQNEGLLDVAKNFPATESGVEAMRMILANNGSGLVEQSLRGSGAEKIAEALGNTGSKDALPMLLPIVIDPTRDLALRKQAVRSAAQTSEGARKLLDLAKEERLPQDLKLTASTELNNVRWEKIKDDAAKILPLPQSHDAKPLPDVAELLKMKGDAANGENVFFRTETSCANCHKINARGTEIGPALSEIGTKLGKDALFESVLDPSAGISFGFEANQIELKSGDEAYGLIVSDTSDELVIKDLKGIVGRYKKSDIAKRQQLKTSIMPTGLQQTMSVQEFVDLVEFLSTLKKAN